VRTPERVEGRGSALRCPDAAAQRPYHNAKLLLPLWILAVAVRLVLINQPFIDHWSWRQSDVAAIARNFCENGFRFGYPQIDWAGNATGYVGTEFPILPFIAAMCYKFAGVHEWVGRTQAVIFFAISLPFFFLLVREAFGSTAAVWSTFFFSFAPLNIFAGRSFMPDVPSLTFSIVGLYFFLRWIRDRKLAPFFIASIAISLSLLAKITSIVVAVPLAYILVGRLCQTPSISNYRRIALFVAIALLPSFLWYWHAYQLAQRFYPHHLFGAGGIRIESFSWYWEIARRTATSSLTPVLAILALIGLFVAARSKPARSATALQAGRALFFHWWLAGMILFIVVVGYGNRHPWYQLPLVPIAAAFAGAACAFFASKISSRRVAIMVSIVLVTSFAVLSCLYVRPFYESSAAQLRNAGLRLSKTTAPDALIVAADTGDPTIFYYAHRKGWHFLEINGVYAGNPSDGQAAVDDLEKLRRGGATQLVFTTNTFWWLQSYPEFANHAGEVATLAEATPEFRIYKLTKATR
jgi:4-amino-4-deoxy-L-arabinose transferase-like glycosyltransferase